MRTTISLMLLAILAQTPAPSQPPVTFKVEVNYVEIDASVTDAAGNFVRSLTKEDFQVLEDGKPQAVTAFSMVDIPIERVDPPLFSKTAIAPDVVTNRKPFEGRVFVLVVDDLHTRFNQTARTRGAARQFVERYVGANDLVAVVNTSGYGRSMQDFTSNRALALKAIDAAMGNKADSSTAAALADARMNRDMPGSGSNANASFNEMQRYNNARNSMRVLRNLADFMSGMRGRRKAVVYFSEGLNYNVTDPFNNPHATDVQREIRELIGAATRANVSIYSVDPRGVTSGMEDAIEMTVFPADGSIKPSDLLNELRLEHDSLRVVADETGGFPVLNQNDFRTAFSRILEDNSSYYVLGYYPANDKADGRFRNVQVKILKPGLKVRARKGYVAPLPAKKKETAPDLGSKGEKATPALRDALDSPIPISGLTISAFAAPFKGAGANVAIAMAIEVDGGAMTFTRNPQGGFANDIEIALYAADMNGKIKDGVRDVVRLALKPQTYEIVRRGAFRVVRRIQVPPGKYQLRIGARESGGGKVGSVIYDLDAPDFSKGNLTMSGIALASASGAAMPTVSPDPNVNEFKDVLPAPPSASREFPRQDTLAVFAEVYDNVAKTPHRVEITAAVLSDEGKVVHTTSDMRKSEELQGATGGYGYTTTIPLAALAPGRYVLRLSATSLLGKPEPVTREIEFRVLDRRSLGEGGR
jgi:VWFA-related protein